MRSPFLVERVFVRVQQNAWGCAGLPQGMDKRGFAFYSGYQVNNCAWDQLLTETELIRMSEVKTNAMRMLDKAKVSYSILTYDHEDGTVHGAAVAERICRPPERVFKTLVAHQGKQLFVFVIPVAEELDLKVAAKAAGVKKVELLPLKELLPSTGYIRGGCSPVGMKKLYPTFIDSSAQTLDVMAVSAGRIGFQMELEPERLAAQVEAVFAPLVRKEIEEQKKTITFSMCKVRGRNKPMLEIRRSDLNRSEGSDRSSQQSGNKQPGNG
ncbi:Cys-tRNA(Pro) deacylase [Paenibacillus filicis]|uniref:Cys-tRNA(Pro) deacylase n=1 Tax=Paenibacillus filicis TaxID=669464 RepID=A0ABU9DEG0_9BACL